MELCDQGWGEMALIVGGGWIEMFEGLENRLSHVPLEGLFLDLLPSTLIS